jgi:DNA-binding MarR family transcriptional regulator
MESTLAYAIGMRDQVAVLDQIAIGAVSITARAIMAAGEDLTFVQWRVLLIVGESSTGATINEIASRMGAHASPTSRLVSRLSRRGLVRTSRDDPDGRVTRVMVTGEGEDLRCRILDLRRGVLAGVLDAAALTPAEIEAIRRLAGAFGAYA